MVWCQRRDIVQKQRYVGKRKGWLCIMGYKHAPEKYKLHCEVKLQQKSTWRVVQLGNGQFKSTNYPLLLIHLPLALVVAYLDQEKAISFLREGFQSLLKANMFKDWRAYSSDFSQYTNKISIVVNFHCGLGNTIISFANYIIV